MGVVRVHSVIPRGDEGASKGERRRKWRQARKAKRQIIAGRRGANRAPTRPAAGEQVRPRGRGNAAAQLAGENVSGYAGKQAVGGARNIRSDNNSKFPESLRGGGIAGFSQDNLRLLWPDPAHAARQSLASQSPLHWLWVTDRHSSIVGGNALGSRKTEPVG